MRSCLRRGASWRATQGGYNGGTLWLAQLLVGVRVVRTRELLLRWTELCAFSGAVFRTHEGLIPEYNHQVWSDNATLAHFVTFARVFAAFRPYRRRLMAEAHAKGWPLIRHPVLHFPHDPVLLADAEPRRGGAGRIREFLLGADWLVVPVVEPGVTTVRGYVPAGEWHPLWCAAAGVVRGPGWMTLPAPLGQPAVYHRAEAASAAEVRKALHAEGVALGECV